MSKTLSFQKVAKLPGWNSEGSAENNSQHPFEKCNRTGLLTRGPIPSIVFSSPRKRPVVTTI